MKLKFNFRLFVICCIIFILVVSFKILEPDIYNPEGAGRQLEERENVQLYSGPVDIKNAIKKVETKHPNDQQGKPAPPIAEPDTNDIGAADPREELDEKTLSLIKKYEVDWDKELVDSPWEKAASWVSSREIHPADTPEMGSILKYMSEAPILHADVGYRGTQLKLSLTLSGGQRVAFKPKWFSRDHVIEGKPYDGEDRHNGEIAGFHLNRTAKCSWSAGLGYSMGQAALEHCAGSYATAGLAVQEILEYRRTPLVVGRMVNLKTEILPVAEERLRKTFFNRGNNTCFYGRCMYCKSEKDGVCAQNEVMEGAIVLWLPKTWTFKQWRHPWGRTYKDGKKARWETDNKYCSSVTKSAPYNTGPRLMDIMDACAMDYLIGNADRHHYETFASHPQDSMLVMLDNAKSFGNPFYDEPSILAPIYQCCKIRRKTYEKLMELKDGVLTKVLSHVLQKDPIAPVLAESHYIAMDRRLEDLLQKLQKCIAEHGEQYVLVVDKYSSS